MHSLRQSVILPVVVVLLAGVLLVAASISLLGGDPLALARLGTRFSEGDPNGTEGYDGQFVYYIARDPRPSSVVQHLDVPAYRYQRILLPVLARGLALGRADLIPWTIPIVNLLALVGGTWAMSAWFRQRKCSTWYALAYGLWAGFTLALVADMTEPLAYGLVAGGLLALECGRARLSWLLIGLSMFARETTLMFAAAFPLVYLVRRDRRSFIESALIALLPYAIFQGWLWAVFGRPGIGSGGAGATPFEIIPFMGLLRIGQESMLYLAAMGFVFGVTIILPAIWGMWVSGRAWLQGERAIAVAVLFLNALVIAFTPYSTFRETGGMIRFATGLVLSVLFYAAKYGYRRALNYSMFWLVLNVFLLK